MFSSTRRYNIEEIEKEKYGHITRRDNIAGDNVGEIIWRTIYITSHVVGNVNLAR